MMTLASASPCELSSQQSSIDVMLLVLSSVFVLFMFVDSWIAGRVVRHSQVDKRAHLAQEVRGVGGEKQEGTSR